jgi:hypothetical protein
MVCEYLPRLTNVVEPNFQAHFFLNQNLASQFDLKCLPKYTFSFNFISTRASSRIQTLDLRIMSQVLYHCATWIQHKYILVFGRVSMLIVNSLKIDRKRILRWFVNTLPGWQMWWNQISMLTFS